MILKYEYFKDSLNARLFKDSYSDLIKKIAENSERYIGLFRPTKPKTKLIQNITQSHEIRFGDALEFIFEKYFNEIGFKMHNKRIIFNEKELNIDLLFSKDDILYMIEQKVRDDHDSTKKVGQFDNFKNKYRALSSLYKNFKIIPIMWFIDDSLKKNENFYRDEIEQLKLDYNCDSYLCYGQNLFCCGFNGFDIAIWQEILDYLEKWKKDLPDMPEINFDKNANNVFNEIKDLSPSIYRKLLTNKNILEQIFPIIFPEKKVLQMLYDDFEKKDGDIYKTLARKISEFTSPTMA